MLNEKRRNEQKTFAPGGPITTLCLQRTEVMWNVFRRKGQMASTEHQTVLALEGGGTKTDVALIDAGGRVLYRAQGTGCNPFDQPRWQEKLHELLTPVQGRYVAAALGLPGYGEAPHFTQQQQAFAASLGVPVVVMNDVEAAHCGAFLGGGGVLVLAGTGSMVWAADGKGRAVRVGGWGDLLGDEGAAYWVGLRALNSLTRALDGRLERTALHDRLLNERILREIAPNNQVQAPEAGQAVLSWVAGLAHPRSGIASLARLVDEAAQVGDPHARHLLTEAANELATLAHTARRRLPDAGSRWSLAGSFTRSQTVRAALTAQLGAANFHAPTLPPLGGVAWLAARQAGWNVSPEWVAALQGQL